MSLDDLQAQLRGTLDQQFAALKQKYEEGIAEARRQADADAAAGREQARAEADARVRAVVAEARAAAERAIADKVGLVRAEAESQLQSMVEEVRAAAQRDAAATIERTRAELEQARAGWETQLQAAAAAARAEGEQAAADAARQEREAFEKKLEEAVDHAVAAARRSAELELESERRRRQKEIDAEREKARTEIDAAREKTIGEAAAAKAAFDAERQQLQAAVAEARQIAAAAQKAAAAAPAAPAAAPAGIPPAAFERMLAAVREIDGARTIGQALESLLQHAAASAGRAAIFLINADRLKAWKAAGIPDVDVQTVESSIGGKDLLARAIQSGQPTASNASLPAPPFARLAADRQGLAVPVMINGRAVAVLYTDSGANPPPPGAADIVETLVRHASSIVALRTAMRTLEVLRGGAPDADGAPAGGAVDDDQGARRYARLLVSEIKLYNEAAVRAGRQQRDLLQRLRAEIDRAQRLYEERVPPAVGGRHVYFQQELVQTLADGDPALLGSQ